MTTPHAPPRDETPALGGDGSPPPGAPWRTGPPAGRRPRRLSRRLRTLVLTAHVLASVGWFGVAASMAVLALVAAATGDDALPAALYRATGVVLVASRPLALGALGTGVVLALGTSWGLVRHYWVVAKLAITAAVLVTGLVVTERSVGEAAASGSGPPPLVASASAHAFALGVATALSTYKPWGKTKRGRRLGRS